MGINLRCYDIGKLAFKKWKFSFEKYSLKQTYTFFSDSEIILDIYFNNYILPIILLHANILHRLTLAAEN